MEIDEQIIMIVEEPCLRIHAIGDVPKGHDDFHAIVDCSSPVGVCIIRTLHNETRLDNDTSFIDG